MPLVSELSSLQSLGLKEAEVQVYLSLLERGPSSIRQIAAATKINRGTTYEALKRLSSLGLVSFRRGHQRRKYFAERPERIHQLVEEKRHELSEVEAVIPQLSSLGQQRVGEPIVRFYEDDEGIVAILRDVLSTTAKLQPKEYYVYSSRPLRLYLYRRFPNFTRRRIKEGITVKVIAVGEGGDPTAELYERRFLPEPTASHLSSYIIIYGQKVALISVSPNETPYGVVIEEPGVASTQRYLFEQLWRSLK